MGKNYHYLNDSMLNFAAFVATRKANRKAILSNQKGNEFLNQGLIILIISLPLAAAAIALCTVVINKYSGLATQLTNVTGPTL